MKVSISLSPKKLGWLLAVTGLLLMLLNFSANIYGHYYDGDQIWPVSRQFDFSEEGNFANWYQSVTLLFCSVLLLANAAAVNRGAPFRKHWIGLALVFLLVSIDEAAQVHETTVSPLLSLLKPHREAAKSEAKPGAKTVPKAAAKPGANAPAKTAPAATADAEGDAPAPDAESEGSSKILWISLYAAIFVTLVLVYLKFFFHLAFNVQVFFVLAAVLYIGGAVGMEFVYKHLTLSHSETSLICQFTSACGELGEMLGVAAFVYALTTNLAQNGSVLEVSCGTGKPRA